MVKETSYQKKKKALFFIKILTNTKLFNTLPSKVYFVIVTAILFLFDV